MEKRVARGPSILLLWAIAIMIAFVAALLVNGNPLVGPGKFIATLVLFLATQAPIWISLWRRRNC
jgi:hypothetical protein